MKGITRVTSGGKSSSSGRRSSAKSSATPTATDNAKKRPRKNASSTRNYKNSSPPTRSSITSSSQGASSLPLHHHKVLILDNGGDSVKYGWCPSGGVVTEVPAFPDPRSIPNITARLQHQWTVLVGDEIQKQVANPNQLVNVTRSTERGIIVNLGNQVQVWKRILEIVHVAIPKNTEAAQAFGWTTKNAKKSSQLPTSSHLDTNTTKIKIKNPLAPPLIPPQLCAVFILLPPYYPRALLDQIVDVWFQDFQFSHVGFGISTQFASIQHPKYNTGCCIDMGYSSIHIVPTIKVPTASSRTERRRKKEEEERESGHDRLVIINEKKAIKRINIGGKHLCNILKYYVTYRQWNLMDSEFLIRDIMEQLCFVSLSFTEDLHNARYTRPGVRYYDRNYILPNYQTIYHGIIDVPKGVQKVLLQRKQEGKRKREEEIRRRRGAPRTVGIIGTVGDKSRKEGITINEGRREEKKKLEKNSGDSHNDATDTNKSNEDSTNRKEADQINSSENSGDDILQEDEEKEDNEEDEESNINDTERELHQQMALIREEKQRRRQQQFLETEEKQVLQISVERFTIPEMIFNPSDSGLSEEIAGLPYAVFESIQSCPPYYHAALYQSISLCGGLSLLPNMQKRLEIELRKLVPVQYDIQFLTNTATSRSWQQQGEKAKKGHRQQDMTEPSNASLSPLYQSWIGAYYWIKQQQQHKPEKEIEELSSPTSPLYGSNKNEGDSAIKWCISRDEWEKSQKRKAWNHLLISNGGIYV